MIGMNENKVTCEDLMECVRKTKAVASAMRDKDFEKVLQLRDPDFISSYEMLHSLNLESAELFNRAKKDVRFAVVHVGAPAGGMNAATRAIVHYSMVKQYEIYGIFDGFMGLIKGDVRPLSWTDVDGWCSLGGSQLGTNRKIPSDDIGIIAYQLQKFSIDGLIIIGGFEAFVSLNILAEARNRYPALCIPMICLPATISNNVPGTEFSIGSDTALNAIVQSCDIIKQSAAASSKRVFVVEVQGGNCGYLATVSGIAAGATYSYIQEEGITINDIQRDANHLKGRFNDHSKMGRIIIKNENASKAYTTEIITSILEEEGQGDFDARCAVLGHLQQGGSPSPLDRIRGTRLAIFCVNFLEKWKFKAREGNYLTDPESMSVIGIKGPHIICTPISELQKEADFTLRRPKAQWWLPFRDLAKILAKYCSTQQIQ